MPNASPKKIPETRPTLPGRSSCANTMIAGNAEASPAPMITDRIDGGGQPDVRQDQRERQDAQDRRPDHVFAAEAIADRAADHRAGGDRGEEDEEQDLRVLHRHAEALDQVERVVARHAREVEEFREDERDQHHDRGDDPCGLRYCPSGRVTLGAAPRGVPPVPTADVPQHDHRHQCDDGEPGDALLAVGNDDGRGEQRPDRGADVAADLEHRLREAVAAAGGHARDARRLGVEDGRADADQRRGDEQHRIGRRHRQQQQAHEAGSHADGQRIRHRPAVGDHADNRLEQRGGQLEDEGDQADLRERQGEVLLQHRIDRRQQRLDRVVEEMGNADRDQDREDSRFAGAGSGAGLHSCVHEGDLLGFPAAICTRGEADASAWR